MHDLTMALRSTLWENRTGMAPLFPGGKRGLDWRAQPVACGIQSYVAFAESLPAALQNPVGLSTHELAAGGHGEWRSVLRRWGLLTLV